MVRDSEDRLKKVMDKLYRAPRPRISALSRSGGGDAIASKRMSVRVLSPRAQVRKAVPCRPWDRGDLIRRLSTFKAMTWFGKPKDISPLNCARRGWINVEMDVIVCEACGARLLFSTPPSWSLKQVEKAAAVFSLKLDNGHKLLCPWINNVCDESLASFPPSPPQSLIDGFKERSHALWHLTTLPVISSLAIDHMKSPQLDRFLSAPLHPSITLNNGVVLLDDCRSMNQNGAIEGNISHGYYQALNIISLCGWEPRLLSYTIDFEDQFGPSSKSTNLLDSLEEISRGIQNTASCSSRSRNDVEGTNDIYLGQLPYDHSSTVLECTFCGACVGLWIFKSIPRPLELFKLIIDAGRQSELSSGTADLAHGVGVPMIGNFGGGDHASNIEKSSGLQLSIAGGPLPNKQKFRPKVSFPIVSRHLRAKLYNSCLKYQQGTSGKENHVSPQKELNGDHDDGSQAGRSLKRKQCELEGSNCQRDAGGNHGDMGDGLADEGRREHTTEEFLIPYTDVVVRDVVPYHSDPPTADARESIDLISKLDQSNDPNSQYHGEVGNGLAGQGRSEPMIVEILTPCTDVVVRDSVPCQSDSGTSDACKSNDYVSRLDQSNGSKSPIHVEGCYGDVGNVLTSGSEHTTDEILTPCTNTIVSDDVPCQSDSGTTDASKPNDSVPRLDQSNGSKSPIHVEGLYGDVGNVFTGGSEHTTDAIPTPCTDTIVSNALHCQSGPSTTDARESNDLVSRYDECRHTPENDHCDPLLSRLDESNYGHTTDLSLSASSSVSCVNLTTSYKSCETGSCFQTVDQESAGKLVSIEFAKEASVSITGEENTDHLSGNPRSIPVAGFDPIKQHRPFCPWISEGKNLPGWKAVLSALNNLENNTSQQPEQTAADSNLLDEIDDPIVSVRKLFMSPPSKRFKLNQ